MNKRLQILALIFCLIIGYFFFSNYTINSNREEKVSEAYNALTFWAQARAYPDKEISEGKFISAFEQKSQIKLNKSSIVNRLDPWKMIGPHNTGGRTIALAFNPQNPNTIYAGSASGGLWVSYTGGIGVTAWKYVPTNIPVLAVSSIAIAPDDSNTIYIGTGEVYNYYAAGTGAGYRNTRGTYGVGILKTTDGGSTWTKSLDWSYNDQHGVWDVVINPLNENTVWAATTEGTYRSFDAGTTWQQVNNAVMAMDLIIDPVDTSIVLTGNGDFQSPQYGIWRTSDDGNNWTKISSGLPTTYRGKIQFDIYKTDPDIMYASIGDGFEVGEGASWLCKSTDAGLTWTVQTTTDYSQHQGWYSHGVAVDQSNPNRLMVIGIEVWNSTNGGTNISQKSFGGVTLGRPEIGNPDEGSGTGYVHSDVHVVIQHPTEMNTFYFGTDGGVFRTTDFGQTFESRNGSYQTTQFYNGTSSSQTDSLFAMGGLQDNSTVIYDGSLAWIRNIGGDGSWSAIDASNDNNLFGSWQNLNILRSTNRGNNFISVTPPGGTNPTAFAAPFVIAYGNSNIVYAGRNLIYKSTNAGNNWSVTNGGNTLDGNFAIAMSISYQDNNKVYVATAPFSTFRGNFFRTDNGGTNWTNITGSLPDRFPADIAVDPNNDNNIYITFYGFGSSHILKSTNGGTDWIDINDNLPDVPAPSVIVDPNNSNHVYVGTDLGVFVSTDGGGNWQDINDGLPNSAQVMDLNICTVNNVLRVMTHGNGAYERKLLSTIITSVKHDQNNVDNFKLEQNYPNPFNPSTKIRFEIIKPGFTTLKIFDLLGNQVKTLIQKNMQPGTYESTFDGTGLASGNYIYRLESNSNIQTKKMMLLK
jgi:photosystem II stability/assembly factor-like uncharacterized protein